MNAVSPTPPVIEVALRPVTSDDGAFIRGLSDDRRRGELEPFALEDAALEQLLKLQFCAHRSQHEHAFPAASDQVIVVAGESVGRLLVDDSADRSHLIDLTVLSRFRGAGIATAVLIRLIERCDWLTLPISLDVVAANPARQLFERLGWDTTDFNGMNHSMTRVPSPAPTGA